VTRRRRNDRGVRCGVDGELVERRRGDVLTIVVVGGEQVLETTDVVDSRSQRVDLARSLAAAAATRVFRLSTISQLLLLLLLMMMMMATTMTKMTMLFLFLLLPAVTRQSAAQRCERDVDQLDASTLAQVTSFHRLGHGERRRRRRRRLPTSAIETRRLQRRRQTSLAAQDLTIVVVRCAIALSRFERRRAFYRQGPRRHVEIVTVATDRPQR